MALPRRVRSKKRWSTTATRTPPRRSRGLRHEGRAEDPDGPSPENAGSRRVLPSVTITPPLEEDRGADGDDDEVTRPRRGPVDRELPSRPDQVAAHREEDHDRAAARSPQEGSGQHPAQHRELALKFTAPVALKMMRTRSRPGRRSPDHEAGEEELRRSATSTGSVLHADGGPSPEDQRWRRGRPPRPGAQRRGRGGRPRGSLERMSDCPERSLPSAPRTRPGRPARPRTRRAGGPAEHAEADHQKTSDAKARL